MDDERERERETPNDSNGIVEQQKLFPNIGHMLLLSSSSSSLIWQGHPSDQCDEKKSPNVYKSCPTMISLEKLKILTPLQKLPNASKSGPKSNKLSNLVTLVGKPDCRRKTITTSKPRFCFLFFKTQDANSFNQDT